MDYEANFSSTVGFEFKYLIFFQTSHVRMAERSKAPDSRVELFLTGVFWSTNVGVGSNPTSDKRFQKGLYPKNFVGFAAVNYPRKFLCK